MIKRRKVWGGPQPIYCDSKEKQDTARSGLILIKSTGWFSFDLYKYYLNSWAKFRSKHLPKYPLKGFQVIHQDTSKTIVCTAVQENELL